MNSATLGQLLKSGRRLQFPPELEKVFREDHASRSIPFIRASVIVAFFTYLAFGLLIPRLNPQNSFKMHVLIFGIMCPVLTLFYVGTLFQSYWKLRQSIFFVEGVAIALGVLGIIGITDPKEPGFAINYVGLILTMESSFILLRLLVSYTTLLTIFILLGYTFVCLAIQGRHLSAETLTVFLNNLLYLVSAAMLSLAGAYLLEVYLRRDFIQRRQLAGERDKTNLLLRSILPDQVADRLRDGTSVIADGHKDVSVLFCGIVGLTPLSERLTPNNLVALLNDIFTRCDQLAEKHGVERIKTMGGIYVAAAEAPVPRSDHAICLARFALELRDTMHAWFQETGQGLSVRMGMCSGPVIGGIIGTRRFIYDLWGETVNVAAGMETHGLIGEIQVADPSYRLLRGTCNFQPRGRIRIAGKESVDAYLVKGFMSGDPARLTGQIHQTPLADGREAQTR